MASAAEQRLSLAEEIEGVGALADGGVGEGCAEGLVPEVGGAGPGVPGADVEVGLGVVGVARGPAEVGPATVGAEVDGDVEVLGPQLDPGRLVVVGGLLPELLQDGGDEPEPVAHGSG